MRMPPFPSPPDPDATAAVHRAAVWLAGLTDATRSRPIVAALRGRYGLSARQAVEAIKLAAEMRRRL